MKLLIIICCWLSISFSFGQNFQIIDTSDYEQRKALVESFKTKYERFNKQLKDHYNGRMRREVTNFYEYTQTNVLQIINNKKLLFDERFESYIDSLYTQLKLNNPILENENVVLLLSKNTSPNALSIGDGTLIFNVGLFSLLENGQQLQSVIAHEIAHLLMLHSTKTIEERAKINVETASNKSELSKNINSDKYNKGERSFTVLKDLLYKAGESKRKQEIEADSLGYVLYKNTHAPNSEFLAALEMLKKFDSVPEIVLDSTIYMKVFDIPEQKFNDAWLAKENFESYNYDLYKEKINLDSLKGHPEIDIRIETLENSFPELESEEKINSYPNSSYKNLQEIARQAYVENLYYLNEYGLSTYLILKHLEEDPDNVYYQKWLGINFNGIYDAKKKYQLNRYVDRLVPNEQSESYQQFLNFIWNLDLKEIKAIADHYNTP